MNQSDFKSYFNRLWPICRSITGNGLRQSFEILKELIPLNTEEIPTGKKVHDWEIPKEWNITDAHIIKPNGERIAEFKKNNLHVLGYSIPVNKELSYEELKQHIYTLPEQPNAIPYVTSYYSEKWGFCLAHNEWQDCKPDGVYRVVIESTLKEGSLTYGHLLLEGESKQEIVFSSYLCHPSMANNELSGPLVLAALYQKINALPRRRFSYRFILAPETIGVVAYLSKYGSTLLENCIAGWVLTCCGDSGRLHFKASRRGDSLTDRISKHILNTLPVEHTILPFTVGGSDERQYCSPGYNLPIGSLMRTPYQKYPEYHTSLDNESFISYAAMEETVELLFQMVLGLELNKVYKTTVPFGEPQLGKRGLYPSSNMPNTNQREFIHELMHFLNWADGENDLLTIAEKRHSSIFQMAFHARSCEEQQLVKTVS